MDGGSGESLRGKILPLAFLFAVSVSFGNTALSYVYPSFNQMVTTMTPLITMVLQVVLLRTRYNFL